MLDNFDKVMMIRDAKITGDKNVQFVKLSQQSHSFKIIFVHRIQRLLTKMIRPFT